MSLIRYKAFSIIFLLLLLAIAFSCSGGSGSSDTEDTTIQLPSHSANPAATAPVLPCYSGPEICGDGIDQDCNGVDTFCPGADPDRDGFARGIDCDDANRNVYPGISVACSADCGNGTQTCQSNGQFTACGCAPLCEARAGGRCYYISAEFGNDSGSGSFDQPLRSTARINSYPEGSNTPKPSNAIALTAGDVVYFMNGEYSSFVEYNGRNYVILLERINGTASAPVQIKAYPGQRPVIRPQQRAIGIWLLTSSFVDIEGFEIDQAYQDGILTNEASSINIRNMWIHDTDGVDNSNLAGVFVGNSVSVRIHNSILNDNYDRTNADTNGSKTENSRNIVLFRGGNNSIDHNTIFQSPPTSAEKTGGCITYKHSSDIAGSTFEVAYNVFWNCFFHAIGSGSPNTYIHHNLILDSDFSIIFKDFGGPTYLRNNLVENNTIVNGGAYSLFMTSSDGVIGNQTYRNNVVVDNRHYDLSRGGIVQIDPYGTDFYYDDLLANGKLNFANNCYNNTSEPVQFGYFSVNNSGQTSKGGNFDLSGWQSFGFDPGSSVVDPAYDQFFRSSHPNCSQFGYLN